MASSHSLVLCRSAKAAAAQAPPAVTVEQVPAGGVPEHVTGEARPDAKRERDAAADAAAAAQQAAHRANLHRLRSLKEGALADLAAPRQPRKPAAPPVSSPPTSLSHSNFVRDMVEVRPPACLDTQSWVRDMDAEACQLALFRQLNAACGQCS